MERSFGAALPLFVEAIAFVGDSALKLSRIEGGSRGGTITKAFNAKVFKGREGREEERKRERGGAPAIRLSSHRLTFAFEAPSHAGHALEVFLQLIEGAAPAAAHRVAVRIERLL